MIYALILSAAGVIIVALAIIATTAIQRNSRLALYKEATQREEERVQADMDALIAENGRLQREIAGLQARNTALVEAMEARPTQPKRTVRKNSTSGEQQ